MRQPFRALITLTLVQAFLIVTASHAQVTESQLRDAILGRGDSTDPNLDVNEDSRIDVADLVQFLKDPGEIFSILGTWIVQAGGTVHDTGEIYTANVILLVTFDENARVVIDNQACSGEDLINVSYTKNGNTVTVDGSFSRTSNCDEDQSETGTIHIDIELNSATMIAGDFTFRSTGRDYYGDVFDFLFEGTLVGTACPGCGDSTRSFTGTVSYKNLEGGFFAIDADKGEHYDPINLPDEFAVDGLRVQVYAIVRHDLVSVHQYGAIIEIIEISPL